MYGSTKILNVTGVDKTFTMHLQDGHSIPVVKGLTLEVHSGECVVLDGASGTGKSSILKMVFGNYAVQRGQIILSAAGEEVDIAAANPRDILAARRDTVGYVSQFLRCVPRVPALEVVAEPLIDRGVNVEDARSRAADLLSRLQIASTMWALPPATFSGGEQQRVNIARGFIADLPLLLLDEPTASLDTGNKQVVIELIAEKLEVGAAVLGVFHDAEVREMVADRVVFVEDFSPSGHPCAVTGRRFAAPLTFPSTEVRNER